ncbi:MAG: nucleotidyltransferase domain-containing protein [Candidatus Bilamarchaeaceae archaeon]
MGFKTGLGKKREKLLKAELRRILAEIKKLGALKIILFGSLNEKQVGKSSDIDLAIIKNTRKRFSERLEELYARVKPRVVVDFFVYTLVEIADLKSSSYFMRRMLERGAVLYEA